jgi:hypothetical protein
VLDNIYIKGANCYTEKSQKICAKSNPCKMMSGLYSSRGGGSLSHELFICVFRVAYVRAYLRRSGDIAAGTFVRSVGERRDTKEWF